MSQKKHKKRHPQNKRPVSVAAEESEFSSDGKRRRMNRTARNILLLTLMLLAGGELLTRNHLIGDAAGNAIALVGIILLLVALWLHVRDPSGGWQSSAGGPRLRYGEGRNGAPGWPLRFWGN